LIIRVENKEDLRNNKISKSQQTLKQKKTQSTTSEKEGGNPKEPWRVRGGCTWRGASTRGRGRTCREWEETSSMWEGGEMRTYQAFLSRT
jgi:hypothetical protein